MNECFFLFSCLLNKCLGLFFRMNNTGFSNKETVVNCRINSDCHLPTPHPMIV